MQQYLLQSHVHMCVTEDHAVLLDLKRDTYVGIGAGQMNTLAASIKGWPGADALPAAIKAPLARNPPPATAGPLAKMLASGMLTTDPAIGKEARPPLLTPPQSVLVTPDLEARPSPSPGQVVSFIAASLAAKSMLRLRPIYAVVRRVQSRKRRAAHAHDVSNLSRARQLVEAFLYLRPLLFDTKDQCLYDSLALIEYLARYRLFPTWVIGVQTRPFFAHSWVQYEGIVLNDTPEYVGRFTPILAV